MGGEQGFLCRSFEQCFYLIKVILFFFFFLRESTCDYCVSNMASQTEGDQKGR